MAGRPNFVHRLAENVQLYVKFKSHHIDPLMYLASYATDSEGVLESQGQILFYLLRSGQRVEINGSYGAFPPDENLSRQSLPSMVYIMLLPIFL